jgi:hypothetical protein
MEAIKVEVARGRTAADKGAAKGKAGSGNTGGGDIQLLRLLGEGSYGKVRS